MDKSTGKIFKNLNFIKFDINYQNELEIGPIENKLKKIKIVFNIQHFNKIFPTNEQYNFENYIFEDSKIYDDRVRLEYNYPIYD